MVVTGTEIDTVISITGDAAVLDYPAKRCTIVVNSVSAICNRKAVNGIVGRSSSINRTIDCTVAVYRRSTAGRVTLEGNGLAEVPLSRVQSAGVGLAAPNKYLLACRCCY